MGPSARRQLALAAAFARAAYIYWFAVFPRVRVELRRWRSCAYSIPDPVLRELALATQNDEQGNLEGAAAFAAFVPARTRAEVIRATVAFQAIYDYVDSLVEQPAADPVRNGRMLHKALDDALGLIVQQPSDYYAHHSRHDDGGYLTALVTTCRDALAQLPSYPTFEMSARRAAERMVEYQALIHAPHQPRAARVLRSWATGATPPGTDLRWWETAAAAASSLLVFALIAEAARPDATPADNHMLENTYFPWVGAFHVLLDSLIDWQDDSMIGHRSLVENYRTPVETAARLSLIARSARVRIDALPRPHPHQLLLAAMACFYLSADGAHAPRARLAAQHVVAALGPLAKPMLTILRVRARLRHLPCRGARGGAASPPMEPE